MRSRNPLDTIWPHLEITRRTLLIPFLCILTFGPTVAIAPRKNYDVSMPTAKLGDGFGFNTHSELSRNGPALMEGAGAQYIRQTWYWRTVEPSKGFYDWSKIDPLLDQLKGTKLRLIATLEGNNPAYGHAASDGLVPGEDWNGYLRFLEATVTRYKGRGIIWQLWNEPNLAVFWGPRPDAGAYSRLSHDVRNWFNSNAPREALVNGGISPAKNQGIGFEAYLRDLVAHDCLKDWDALAFHPYCIYPEEAHGQWAAIKRIVGNDIPLISTEQGYSWKWFKDWGWVGTRWGKLRSISPNNETKLREAAAQLDLDEYKINVQEGVRITIIYDWPDTQEQMGFVATQTGGVSSHVSELPGLNVFRDYFKKLRASGD